MPGTQGLIRETAVSLQAIQVFCEVVRLQSFSRGAAACGISQSAASQVVRHIEKELELKLLERKVRPPRPTPEGEIYYRGCLEILHRHRLTVEEMRRLRQQVTGDFRVASIYSVGLHTLRPQIMKFMQENPDTRIRLEYLLPDEVYAAVLNDEADLGVTSYPRPEKGLVILPWLEEEMVLVASPEHPLAKKPRIAAADLEGQRFVAFVSSLPIRREVDRALRQKGISVDLVSEFDNIETMKQAVELSASLSLLPRPTVQREVERGTLAARPLDFDLRRPVGLIHKKRKRLTYTVVRFIEALLAAERGRPAEAYDAAR